MGKKENDDALFEKIRKAFEELYGADASAPAPTGPGEPDAEETDDSLAPDDDDADDDALDNLVVLNDEKGEEHTFEFLDLIEHDGEEYVALLPVGDTEGEVVILHAETASQSDETCYASVDDEKTLQEVFAIFKERFQGEFLFEDE